MRDRPRLFRVLRGAAVLVVVLLSGLPAPPPVSSPPASAPGSSGAAPSPSPGRVRGDSRFLILGLTQDRLRTDTLEVVQYDETHHQVRILGVPRDIGIRLPGIGFTKLAHAYATGGVGRARTAVMTLLDIPIAHYVVFTLPAMRHLVDLIGGIPITVEKRMVYTDRQQGLVINLQPGPQILDGAKAEQYLRFRNDPEGDIGRIRRQQHFLRAALAAVHRPAVWMHLPHIAEVARTQVETDLTKTQILLWIRRVEGLTPDAVSAHTIEGRPVVLWDDLARMRLDFWQPDPEDLRAKVRWLITGVPPIPKP